jgi:hypothetical protein
VIGERDRGSERALCCEGKRCFVLDHGAEAGVRRSVAVMKGGELNRGRRYAVMWVLPPPIILVWDLDNTSSKQAYPSQLERKKIKKITPLMLLHLNISIFLSQQLFSVHVCVCVC